LSANQRPTSPVDPVGNSQADSDRTILVPAPGGKRATSAPSVTPAVTALPVTFGVGLNPLVLCANPLLDLVGSLRQMTSHADIEQLRTQLVASVRLFETNAKAALIPSDAIAVGRFCLCTLLDETIASTPWGGSGIWANRSLLVTFHNEASGGEKFFLLLQKLGQAAAANLDTLELMYLCLALGLEGRYRVIENGRSQLEELRERLLKLIQQHRGKTEAELSLHWRAVVAKGNSLWHVIPIWVIALVVLVCLIILQLILGFFLNRASDPVNAALYNLKVTQQVSVPAASSAIPFEHIDRVASFLKPEIDNHLISVTDTVDRSVITLIGQGLFASGSAEVNAEFVPLLQRIADAIKPLAGQILVVGHTDNVKGGLSARYPSNWDLSKGRADSVKMLLAERAGPSERYRVEGRGDADPLVPNDSPEHRARNRRVDIIVTMPRLP